MQNGLSSLVDSDLMYGTFGPATTLSRYQYQDELNEYCEAGRAGKTLEERVDAYTKLVNLITDEAMEVTLFYDVVTVAYNKNLDGVKIHMLKMFNFKDWCWKL